MVKIGKNGIILKKFGIEFGIPQDWGTITVKILTLAAIVFTRDTFDTTM